MSVALIISALLLGPLVTPGQGFQLLFIPAAFLATVLNFYAKCDFYRVFLAVQEQLEKPLAELLVSQGWVVRARYLRKARRVPAPNGLPGLLCVPGWLWLDFTFTAPGTALGDGELVCPEGAGPGQSVTIDHNGVVLQVLVPPGIYPGQRFPLPVPPPVPANAVLVGNVVAQPGSTLPVATPVCFLGPATALFWPNDAKLVWSHFYYVISADPKKALE